MGQLPGRSSLAAGRAVHLVRALDLSGVRLGQTYRRLDDRRSACTADGGFAAVLAYDASGLVVDDPGIAVRAA